MERVVFRVGLILFTQPQFFEDVFTDEYSYPYFVSSCPYEHFKHFWACCAVVCLWGGLEACWSVC